MRPRSQLTAMTRSCDSRDLSHSNRIAHAARGYCISTKSRPSHSDDGGPTVECECECRHKRPKVPGAMHIDSQKQIRNPFVWLVIALAASSVFACGDASTEAPEATSANLTGADTLAGPSPIAAESEVPRRRARA